MGYFDSTFIMKDDDVSSFGGYVHEKAKHVIHGNQCTNTSLWPVNWVRKRTNYKTNHHYISILTQHYIIYYIFKAFNETPQNILTRHHGKPPSSCDIIVVQQHHQHKKNTLKWVLLSNHAIWHLNLNSNFSSSFRILFTLTINCPLSSGNQYNPTQTKPNRLNNNFNITAVHMFKSNGNTHLNITC